jgi:ribosome-associated protein
MPEEPGATEEKLDMDGVAAEDGRTAGDEEGTDRESGIPPRDRPRVPHTSQELELVYRHALLAAATASGMKGEDIRILDMHDLVTYTDYLVICTGRSTRQTRRIGQEVAVKLKYELGLMPTHVAGETAGVNSEGGEWILMDYLDFVVHVFTPEAREFYRLDHLWKDAPAEIIE